MKSAFTLLLLVCCVLSQCYGQTGRCQPQTNHACVSRDKFQDCSTGENSSGDIKSCIKVDDLNTANYICYGSAKSKGEICGPSPPACNSTGVFAVPNRCGNLYACIWSGNHYTQHMDECEPGFSFSEGLQRCLPAPECNPVTDVPADEAVLEEQCEPFSKIPDPESCRHFFKCNESGKSKENILCPFDLRFDTKTKVCKRLADCGDRPMKKNYYDEQISVVSDL